MKMESALIDVSEVAWEQEGRTPGLRAGPRRSKSGKASWESVLGWTWETTKPGKNIQGPAVQLMCEPSP